MRKWKREYCSPEKKEPWQNKCFKMWHCQRFLQQWQQLYEPTSLDRHTVKKLHQLLIWPTRALAKGMWSRKLYQQVVLILCHCCPHWNLTVSDMPFLQCTKSFQTKLLAPSQIIFCAVFAQLLTVFAKVENWQRSVFRAVLTANIAPYLPKYSVIYSSFL
jgi:hypothetical protein